MSPEIQDGFEKNASFFDYVLCGYHINQSPSKFVHWWPKPTLCGVVIEHEKSWVESDHWGKNADLPLSKAWIASRSFLAGGIIDGRSGKALGRQGTRLIFARHAFNQVLLAVWGLAAALFALLGALRLLYLYPRLSRLAGFACLNARFCMICGERMLLWPCECVGRPSLPAKKLRLVGGTPFSPSKRVRSEVLRNGWCLLSVWC